MKKIYIAVISIIIFLLIDLILLFFYFYKETPSPLFPNSNYAERDTLNTNNLALQSNVNQQANINQEQIPDQNLSNLNINQQILNINAAGETTNPVAKLSEDIRQIIIKNAQNVPMNIVETRNEILKLDEPEKLEPALINIATSQEEFKNRFIALNSLFVLEYKKTDKNPQFISALKSLLLDNDFQVQIIAGEYLVMLGYKEGFPIIIEGLLNKNIAAYSDPPTFIFAESQNYLKSMTNQNFSDYTSWKNWWRTNQDNLKWNNQTQKFE